MQITESPNISNVTEQHLAIKDAILPYLEVKGLISLSQTCKTARSFFLDTVLFDYINSSHTSLQLFKFDPICLKNILRKSGAQLSCLKLTRVTTQVASRLISECPNLIHLEIESLKDKESNWFCSLVETGILKAEKLRTLILLDCHLGVQDANQIALLKNLTHLDLWGNRDLTKGKNRLINFEPISSENQYDQGTFQFHLTQLTYLDLSFTSWNSLYINASRLAPNFELFQQLTELIYDGVTLSDSDFFSFIDSLKTLTHLQKLSLQNTDIRETKAKCIADNLHNITSLDIRFNYTPSIGVIGILTSLEKLTEIKFHGGLIIEEIPQIVDALLTRDDFSRFVHHYYYNQLNKEDNKMLEEQKKRILNKFPNCHIVLDSKAFGSRSIGQGENSARLRNDGTIIQGSRRGGWYRGYPRAVPVKT